MKRSNCTNCKSTLQYCRPSLYRTHSRNWYTGACWYRCGRFSNYFDFRLLCYCGGGRCTPCSHSFRAGQSLTCRKNIGEWFCAIITFYAPDICLILSFYGAGTFVYRCVQSDSRICYGLSFDLLDRYSVCRGFCRVEYLY